MNNHIKKIDPSYFNDIADTLGLPSPALPEKDYYAVQLLKLIKPVNLEGYNIVFAGGTCLSKVHLDIKRMSEDIDLKLVPNTETLKLSNNQQIKLRRKIHKLILKRINESKLFKLDDSPRIRNEYRYQEFSLQYPKSFKLPSLRPELKLELTTTTLLQEATNCNVQSFYSQCQNQDPEIINMRCTQIESIAIEKLIALLRRTALNERKKDHDSTLVRHLYDLYQIHTHKTKLIMPKTLFLQTLEIDKEQFANLHKEFRISPIKELELGYEILTHKKEQKEFYKNFIDDMVYHKDPPAWLEVTNNLERLLNKFIS